MLEAALAIRLGAFELEIELLAEAGQTLVLVGESGSGKTTTLHLLAGLLHPRHGRIALDGIVLCDTERKIAVPAHRRPIGYVFQEYALFPHLSALENVAFGLRASGAPGRKAKRRSLAALEAVGASDLAARRPAQLSGGQKQRVALARALVLEPRLLLLDEPFAALDVRARRQLRGTLKQILASWPGVTVFVTHSPLEAVAFGERIAVIERGRVVQCGDRSSLLLRPRSAHVAEMVGLNLWQGRLESPAEHGGLWRVQTGDGLIYAAPPAHDADPLSLGAGEVFAAVDPRDVTLQAAPPEGPVENVRAGEVTQVTWEGPPPERVRVQLNTHPPLMAEVAGDVAQSLGVIEGKRLFASFGASAVRIYP